MTGVKQEQVEQLKQQGNDCVKAGNFTEAVLHYSHAIKIDATNHLLYSNRSLAFLKIQQYYLAHSDAKQAIKLKPAWPKGFFRKGEVEFEVGDYASAFLSFGQALLLEPTNENVKEAVSKTNKQLGATRRKLRREPWLFCGGGALLGLLIVLADQFLADKPTIQYVILQLLLVGVFTGLGFLCWQVYRYLQNEQKRSLLEPPVDLLAEMEGRSSQKETEETEDTKSGEPRPHRKGGASAARQRYKKGKS